MPSVKLVDQNNKEIGNLNLNEKVWGVEKNDHLVWQVVKAYLANQRQGTACTKNRKFISGGGIKPFRQKGTGRARQGTSRSPLQRGGGVVFGPNPRDFTQDVPKKMKRGALCSALSDRVRNERIIFVDGIEHDVFSTKKAVQMLNQFTNDKVLLVADKGSDKLYRSTRNIKKAFYANVSELNIYDVLNSKMIIMTKDAVANLEQRLAGGDA